jgi:hypothetical protein
MSNAAHHYNTKMLEIFQEETGFRLQDVREKIGAALITTGPEEFIGEMVIVDKKTGLKYPLKCFRLTMLLNREVNSDNKQQNQQ